MVLDFLNFQINVKLSKILINVDYFNAFITELIVSIRGM